jgi:hypothetical protein
MRRLPILAILASFACRSDPEKPDTAPLDDDTGIELVDADGDGYDASEDCDDEDAAVHPGAEETCNGIDDDCDGATDEDPTDGSTWYADADGDGYGDAGQTVEGCDPGEGWTEEPGDCDDSEAAVHPGAEEICNGIDDDCDGETDEGLQQLWWVDADGDGYGDPEQVIEACEQAPGTADPALGADCDDANSAIHPAATELCNGYDDDCDALVDDEDPDLADPSTWYADKDGDGWGDPSADIQACEAPSGYVEEAWDCDDDDSAFHPGATEDDCTDPNDYNCDGAVAWADSDGDGWAACEECDDSDPAVHPDADERCNGYDDDCDGLVDEDDAIDAAAWYADADGDGYGDASSSTSACNEPTGFVADSSDCDDGDAATFPGAAELCNDSDDDCDGLVDDDDPDLGDPSTWYADSDGDGWGDGVSSTSACDAPSGYVAYDGDCDDSDPAYHPGAVEDDCTDPNDYDCDGSVAWADADGDGWAACEDCDDGDAAVKPDADELCNGVDDDCDGSIDEDDAIDASTWYADTDGDGYGDAASSTSACSEPSGYIADDSDCDDGDAAINPAADEACNGYDDDCDGLVDDDDSGVVDPDTWYADADGDGYGDAASSTSACGEPSGFIADDGDCDDGDAGVHPGATEHCDGVDEDCSGGLSWLEEDPDGDGLLACEVSLWMRTDAVHNNDPGTSGSHGSSEAAALLAAEGVDFDTASLDSTAISASLLDSYGLLVLHGMGDFGPLDSGEAAALEDWVRDGGSLLYMAYHPYDTTCAMVDSLPSAFGLACADYADHWGGTATVTVSHALTSGVSAIVGAGGEHWTLSGATVELADYGGWPVLAALELDDGRLVGLSDEWAFYNTGSGSADISAGDNHQLVENIWAWLADLPL